MTLHSVISDHRTLNPVQAIVQLLGTLCVYFISLFTAIKGAGQLAILLPSAFVCGISAVRLYMLQHDCMHRCFIAPRWLNDAIGVALSPFTLTPFGVGRHNHNLHHSHVGDLDHRDTFEINVLTLREYRQLPTSKRLAYRLYRSPFMLILIGPFLVYVIFHRFPKNTVKAGLIADVLLHNLLFFGFFAAVYGISGTTGIWVLLLSIWFGVSFGAIIPYVEHTFEDVHWGRRPDLTPKIAALEGSAVLDFGDVFHFVTANIGFHDLHHLNPMVPSYNLKRCYEQLETQGLLKSRKIKVREAISCFRWKLWDEERQKMVTFAAA